MSPAPLPDNLASWARSSLAAGENILATSNQGTVLLFEGGGQEYVLKTAMGRGAALRARRATLEREHGAYERLSGVAGVPRCYGMLEDEFLVLEYVRGTPYREAAIEDRESWFAELLQIIRQCHDRGVAHGDMKNKGNIISDEAGRPRLIDFGTTVLRKDGFHPINQRIFAFLCQLDLNAWVKHKYQGNFSLASEADQAIYRDSRIERVLRWGRQRLGWQGAR